MRTEILAARLAISHDDFEEAQNWLNHADETARALDLKPARAEVLRLSAALAEARGDAEAARGRYLEAVGLVEMIRSSLPGDRFRSGVLGAFGGLFEDAAAFLVALPDGAEPAFNVVEQGRSRSLLEIVRAGRLGSIEKEEQDFDQLSQRLDEAVSAVNALSSRLFDLEDHATEDAKTIRMMLERHEREIIDLESRLAAAASFGALFEPPIALGDLQNLLAEDEAVMEYFTTREHFAALVVTRDGIAAHSRLCSRADAIQRIERLYLQIDRAILRGLPDGPAGERLTAAMNAELEALHDLIVAPLRPRLDAFKRLTIIPHGPLHAVPFEALRSSGEYLLERLLIQSAPSASLFAELRRRARRSGSEVRPSLIAAVGDARTPAIEDEAAAVAAIVPNATLLPPAEATIGNVIQQARSVGLIHLATHGRFSTTDPLSSGLRLADGWLTARDLYRLMLDRPLIVLSGCDTGRIALAAGEEVSGFVGAVIGSGARAAILSRWASHDRNIGEMVAGFYRALYTVGTGRTPRPPQKRDRGPSTSEPRRPDTMASPAAALREAQRHMIDHGISPAAWAGLVFVGGE